MASKPSQAAPRRALVLRHGVHPERVQRAARRAERDCADDVGRAGFVAVGSVRPDGAVERHELDRPAALEERGGVAEPADRADEGAAPKGA